MSFELGSSDVARVVATVEAADIVAPIVTELALSGTQASGTIRNVPAGRDRTVKVECFPGAPEASTAIYRASATTTVRAGQATSLWLSLRPVHADVSVTAGFPAGDVDIARIDHVAVEVTGPRMTRAVTYYLALDEPDRRATGTAQKIPVGATRDFAVKTFGATKELLHSGTTSGAVLEAANAVVVELVNVTSNGAIAVGGGLCSPICTNRECGDDFCGGSCGGCPPRRACASGHCGACVNAFIEASGVGMGTAHQLSWDPVPDATGYVIEATSADGTTWTDLQSTTATSVDNTGCGVPAGHRRVRALLPDGGTCVSDVISCCSGCMRDGTCFPGTSNDACGAPRFPWWPGGGQCETCGENQQCFNDFGYSCMTFGMP